MKTFTPEQTRYSRHLLLDEIGEEGLRKIRSAKVLVVGAGGLGSSAILYLAAAGVGKIGIIDGDRVDITNLQRQIIHYTSDIDREKPLSAANKIEQQNPEVAVECYPFYLTAENGEDIVSAYDYVLECTDSFRAKFLVNDLCVACGKPYTHGSAYRFYGQCFTYVPGAACYRCLYPLLPQDESKVPDAGRLGILGAVAGTIGTLQAAEALKYITETGRLCVNRILMYDALKMSFRSIGFDKNADCPLSHL